MNQVAVGVGSNIDPQENIDRAKKLISESHRFLRESTRLTTEPVGFKDQANFINCAFLLETEYDFDSFAEYLKELESKLGRVRTENKFGPRTIDLDIVVWNGQIVDPDFNTRTFLKDTILQILPNLTS